MLNRGYAYTTIISSKYHGRTLLSHLASLYPHSTPEAWQQNLNNREVTVNGITAAESESITSGQTLVWNRPPWVEPDTVLQEVIADTTDDPPSVRLKLHWAGVSHTELTVPKNRTGYHNHINSQEVTELIRELALVCEDTSIVSILNRLGYRTGNGNTWTEKPCNMSATQTAFPPVHHQTSGCGSPCNKPPLRSVSVRWLSADSSRIRFSRQNRL
jgi:hypothetical protein